MTTHDELAQRYIDTWNDHPKTFIWTKQPADLIKKVVRRKH